MDTLLHYIRLGNRLMPLGRPLVMAIINVTPDSFFPASRAEGEQAIRAAVRRAIDEGADILDIGACSTRPAIQARADEATSEQQEWQRLQPALSIIRDMQISVPVSVDTFRPAIARRAIEQFGVGLINDISGGNEAMYRVIAEQRTAYVLTYNRPAEASSGTEHLLAECMDNISRKVDQLHQLGVSDVIIDPGFGFNQSVEQSLYVLQHLRALMHIGCPILVGISRKRMAYAPHGLTPQTCLRQTLELEREAICNGAAIIRVHDVAPTIQMIKQ